MESKEKPSTNEEAPQESPAEMVEISAKEYRVLNEIVFDLSDMIGQMKELADLFSPKPGEPPITNAGDVFKLMISKPGRIKKIAHAMAPIIASISPYVEKYGNKLPKREKNVNPE